MGFTVGSCLSAATAPRMFDGVTFRPIGFKNCETKLSALSLNSLLKGSEYPGNDGSSLFPMNRQLCWKSNSIMGSTRGLPFLSFLERAMTKRRNHKPLVRNESQQGDECINPKGEFSYRRSSAPNRGEHCSTEPLDQSGYEIKVSKEMMGVFQYVEKVKRARLRELSGTLRQVAGACLVFSFVKGFVTPLVEVFKTDPPSWGKLIMFIGAFDAFAVSYMAIKAREPLDKLSALATECADENDMMGSIEKEEELMLSLAMELVGLFGRLRYLTLCTAVAQLAHIIHALLQVRGIQSNLPIYFSNFVSSWFGTPWA
ncbi:hypothetical protein Mapa_012845 [Marchantia paleacea]|nr:hypothetical protein Mapa_012845 [Marchantia paleacea]